MINMIIIVLQKKDRSMQPGIKKLVHFKPDPFIKAKKV